MYAALKYQQPRVTMCYSELCQFAPQHRHTDGSQMSKQMYRVHQPHLRSGYLADVTTQSVLDEQGSPDWLLQYTPGPKAWAEYRVFTGRNGCEEPPLRALRPAGEPQAALSERAGSQVHEPPFVESCPSAAAALVQRFYQHIHGVSTLRPHPKEIDHANALIEIHGRKFATFFVDFACQTARRNGFNPDVFGGLMRYEARALTAYRRQQAKWTREAAEATEDREARLRQQYEHERRERLRAYRDGLSPAALAALEAQVRADLMATEAIPRSVLGARLKAELHDRLALQAGVLPYEAWLHQREKTLHGAKRFAAGVGPTGDRITRPRKSSS
jgi:hypothetical protein